MIVYSKWSLLEHIFLVELNSDVYSWEEINAVWENREKCFSLKPRFCPAEATVSPAFRNAVPNSGTNNLNDEKTKFWKLRIFLFFIGWTIKIDPTLLEPFDFSDPQKIQISQVVAQKEKAQIVITTLQLLLVLILMWIIYIYWFKVTFASYESS